MKDLIGNQYIMGIGGGHSELFEVVSTRVDFFGEELAQLEMVNCGGPTVSLNKASMDNVILEQK